jgi:hypothetical protein
MTSLYGQLCFEHLRIRNWGPARRVGSPKDQFCICFVLRISKLGPRPEGGESGGPISNLSAKYLSVSLWLGNKSAYRKLVSTVCGAQGISFLGNKGRWVKPTNRNADGGKMG